jgi:hypothetical protein
MTMTTIARTITGGVDTHLDLHVAAAVDERGALLGVERMEPAIEAEYAAVGSSMRGYRTRAGSPTRCPRQ